MFFFRFGRYRLRVVFSIRYWTCVCVYDSTRLQIPPCASQLPICRRPQLHHQTKCVRVNVRVIVRSNDYDDDDDTESARRNKTNTMNETFSSFCDFFFWFIYSKSCDKEIRWNVWIGQWIRTFVYLRGKTCQVHKCNFSSCAFVIRLVGCFSVEKKQISLPTCATCFHLAISFSLALCDSANNRQARKNENKFARRNVRVRA